MEHSCAEINYILQQRNMTAENETRNNRKEANKN